MVWSSKLPLEAARTSSFARSTPFVTALPLASSCSTLSTNGDSSGASNASASARAFSFSLLSWYAAKEPDCAPTSSA
jgi:hypothetical protein